MEKLRKEYSDLSAEQKITYVKRGVIIGICNFIPIVVVMGLFLGMMTVYFEASEDIPLQQTNSTQPIPTQTIPTETNDDSTSFATDLWLVGILILVLGSIFGLISLGIELGVWISEKLNLYTDFELERAQKQLDKIKEVLKN